MLVLAGGFGSRLRAAVADVPKPMAPVGSEPFLRYQIENWIAQGVPEITFLLYHRADLIEAYLESLSGQEWLRGCRLRVVREPRPLGTGGAIAHAVRELDVTGSFLVTNADTWLESGIHVLSQARVPSIAIVRVDDSGRYGAVRLGRFHAIDAFEEKRDGAGGGWINAGLYHLEAGLFRDWNSDPFSLEGGLFPRLARSGRLEAVPLQAAFLDIGVPEDYFRFCRWVGAGKAGAL